MKGQEATVKYVKGKFQRHKEKKPLEWECLSTEQAVQRCCGETVLEDVENSAFHRPEQSDLASNLYMHRAGGTSRGCFDLSFFIFLYVCIHKICVTSET